MVDPQGGQLTFVPGDAGDTGQTTFLAPPVLSGSSELPPGTSGTVQLYFTPAVTQGSVELDAYADTFDDPTFAATPIDWAAVSQSLQPAGVSNDSWNAYVSANAVRYGNTYGALFNFLTGQIQSFNDPDCAQAIWVDGQWLFTYRPQDPLDICTRALVLAPPDLAPSSMAGTLPPPPPTPVTLQPGPPSSDLGNTYVLIIADDFINQQTPGVPGLPGVDADVRALDNLFRGTYNLPASQVQTLQSTRTQPLTPRDVEIAIDDVLSGKEPNDRILIFIDSHGRDGTTPEILLDNNLIITAGDLNSMLQGAACPVYLTLDTCSSGAVTAGINRRTWFPSVLA